MNSKYILDLKGRVKLTELVEENTGVYLCEFEEVIQIFSYNVKNYNW